jgi:Holliday junction resolvasome RuvABC DNA-binding subunit
MIASLNGQLKLKESNRVSVETAGVGYEVFIPLATIIACRPSVLRSTSRFAR